MKKRYSGWASAIAILSALAGCGELEPVDPNNSGGTGGATGGAGGAGGVGGTLAGGAGGTTGGAGGTGMPGGVGGMSGGAAGVMASGGTGGMSSGGVGGGGAGGDMGGAGGGDGGAPTMGSCLPSDDVDTLKGGPHPFTHIEDGGDDGGAWVFYPENIGLDGMTHPVFNWGPGALTQPASYVDHLNHLASHGFVVISRASTNSGTNAISDLDWIIAQNEVSGSPFYQKLDLTKVGAGGHSLGALMTMAIADDERLSLYVLVCGGCMSGNGGCGAADIHGPTVILGGDADNPGTPNFEADYEEIPTGAAFVIKDGTDHFSCARENLSPWTAFMRWHFCGEEKWKAKFMDGGEYCASPWGCQSKGF